MTSGKENQPKYIEVYATREHYPDERIRIGVRFATWGHVKKFESALKEVYPHSDLWLVPVYEDGTRGWPRNIDTYLGAW